MKPVAVLGIAAGAIGVLFITLMAFTKADVGPSTSEASPTQAARSHAAASQAPESQAPLSRATARRWPASGMYLGSEYRPGTYYWDGQGGWMHNGYQDVGPGEGVSITMSIAADDYVAGPTAVTLAGHDGTYRETVLDSGVRRQVSVAEIDGRSVMVVLEVEPKATADEVAEAQAIIASLQYEPSDSNLGFSLLFSLPRGWDSG